MPDDVDAAALKARAGELLKLVRSQARRAFVVELAGTPKAGKSTSVGAIEQFFEQCGFRVHLLKERAAECPLPMKGHFFFNSWTTASMLAEVLEKVDTETDLMILDRGFFDALMWLELQRARGQVTNEEAEVFSKFVLLPRWRQLVDVTVVMSVDPETAMTRENQHRIVPREGSIMAPQTLVDLNAALQRARDAYGSSFALVDPPVQMNDVRRDNAALVTALLCHFESWADRTILAVPRALLAESFGDQDSVSAVPLQNGEAMKALEAVLAAITCQKRSALELDGAYVQLVGCALPRDRTGGFFLLRRGDGDKKKASFGRYTLWKGCHLEGEAAPSSVGGLLELAAEQLKMRLRTDFHLALPLEPRFRAVVWNRAEPHAGLMFEVPLPNDDVARNMKQKEFRRQGRFEGLSGDFRSRAELASVEGIEPWSSAFLRSVADHE